MNRVCFFILMSTLSLLCLAQGQSTQNNFNGLGIEFSAEYQDIYLFRGRVLDEEAGVNGSLTLGVGRISYNYYSHQQLGSSEESFAETNHSIEMTWLTGSAVQTTGYRFYDFDNGMPDTQELYYRIAYQSAWHPTFGTFLDIDSYSGYYFDLSLDRMIPLTRHSLTGLKLYIAGATGLTEDSDRLGQIYEYGYFGDDGVTNGYAKLYFRWYPTNRWTFEVSYRYYKAFDELLEQDPKTGTSLNMVSAKIRYVFP